MLMWAASCTAPDPIVGTWRFADGSTVEFRADGSLAGVADGGSPKWTGRWEREGDRLTIDGPTSPVFGPLRAFQITKQSDHELYLKAVETGRPMTSQRVVP
jgi:hypothetical protein